MFFILHVLVKTSFRDILGNKQNSLPLFSNPCDSCLKSSLISKSYGKDFQFEPSNMWCHPDLGSENYISIKKLV